MNTKLIDIALSQYGVTEIPGKENNPDVVKYFHETGRTDINSEDVSWCDAFMDWVVMKAGGQPSPGLLARAWLDVGEKVEKPQQGDLVIFWRESTDSWKGHVGIYIRETDKSIYVLGGNQNNQVCIKAFRKDRVLGYRRLEKEEKPSSGIQKDKHQHLGSGSLIVNTGDHQTFR